MKNNIDKILTELARAEMMGLDYMFENRGVYDKATAIIDECLDLIKERLGEAQLLRVDNDKNVYYLEIISDLKTDCFMKNIRLMIYLNVPREGYVVEIKKPAVFAHTTDLTIKNYGTEEKPIWKAVNNLARSPLPLGRG